MALARFLVNKKVIRVFAFNFVNVIFDALPEKCNKPPHRETNAQI